MKRLTTASVLLAVGLVCLTTVGCERSDDDPDDPPQRVGQSVVEIFKPFLEANEVICECIPDEEGFESEQQCRAALLPSEEVMSAAGDCIAQRMRAAPEAPPDDIDDSFGCFAEFSDEIDSCMAEATAEHEDVCDDPDAVLEQMKDCSEAAQEQIDDCREESFGTLHDWDPVIEQQIHQCTRMLPRSI